MYGFPGSQLTLTLATLDCTADTEADPLTCTTWCHHCHHDQLGPLTHLTLVETLIQRQDWLDDQVTLVHGVARQGWHHLVSSQSKAVPGPLTVSHLVTTMLDMTGTRLQMTLT